MPKSLPGGSAASRRPLLVAIVIAVPFAVLAMVGCSEASDSADADTSTETDEGPATGSNENFQATEVAESLDAADEGVDAIEPSFPPAPDGYLVWAHPLQPAGLAISDQVDGGLYTTSWIREGLLESLYTVDAARTYQPELLASDATVEANENGTVTISYQLRPGLVWSDGVALTADDVAYTHAILMEGCLTEADGSAIDVSNEGCVYPLSDRTGYDLVTSFDVEDDIHFTVRMAAFYPDWRSLYHHIFAAHAFGEDASAVAANLGALNSGGSAAPSSGPLVFESWGDGSLRLARNAQYHGRVDGGDPASIGGVQVNFVNSVDQALSQVVEGQAHVALPGPSEEVLDLAGSGAGGRLGLVAQPALEFEHLGLNLLDPHLADPQVRLAVLDAVGRRDLTSVYGDVVGETVTADGVGNAYWLPGQSGYQDHQPAAIVADPSAAAGRLVAAGYSRGGDGVFSHPDRGSLRLRLLTNGGDSIRVAIQQALISQLNAAGFAVSPMEATGGAFLTEGPFSEAAIGAAHSAGASGGSDVWDMALFAWAGGPWPGLQSGAFRSQSGANPYGYANPAFDSESSRCDGLVDDAERSVCYQTLDTFVTTVGEEQTGLVVIPLVERPQLLVYNTDTVSVTSTVTDGPSGGPLAVIEAFTLN